LRQRNKESDGDTPPSEAAAVGISNCLTCHNPATTLVQDWMNSRHGNHMLASAKLPNDTETPGADPSPSSCAYECTTHSTTGTTSIGYVRVLQTSVTDWALRPPLSAARAATAAVSPTTA
jgi:hypothetical protein